VTFFLSWPSPQIPSSGLHIRNRLSPRLPPLAGKTKDLKK
jgi:hypothetical protein